MDFEIALYKMENGKYVKSEVSKTVYSMSMEGKGKLFAEGLEVPANYLTKEEMLGEWTEVNIIHTEEEVRQLSDDQVEEMLKDAFVKFKFDQKVGR